MSRLRHAGTGIFFLWAALWLALPGRGQEKRPSLSVDSIMRDPRWMGTQPGGIFWTADGETVCFTWNPNQSPADSLYGYSVRTRKIRKWKREEAEREKARSAGHRNVAGTEWVYEFQGDLYRYQKGRGDRRITQTLAWETNPRWLRDGRIVFQQGLNLFSWNSADGQMRQETDIRPGFPEKTALVSPADSLLRQEEKRLFVHIRERLQKPRSLFRDTLRTLYLGAQEVEGLEMSPDGQRILLRLRTKGTPAPTEVPSFVNPSGYTIMLKTRENVGHYPEQYQTWIWDKARDTVYRPDTLSLPGRRDRFPFAGNHWDKGNRQIRLGEVVWNPSGKKAVLEYFSKDNKDRWLVLFESNTGKLRCLERQTDSAWIGGPGSEGSLYWVGEDRILFSSEETGYAHLYSYDVVSGQKRAETKGAFEIQSFFPDPNSFWVYATANPVHPGIHGLYRFRLGNPESWTSIGLSGGGHELWPSPDFQHLAFRYSTATRPWELYTLPASGTSGQAVAVTDKSRSPAFRRYPWREPEFVTFPARDGARVHARLYKPAPTRKNGAAVLFVHGAGYLQNAHQHWSHYFREYFFHNLLCDLGYTVLDIDYRGSAGYGRNWRTGIYRHMGGKDLSDYLDGLAWLQKREGLDPRRAGIYGGSYGGFITLMAMFTAPNTFQAGAALRSVTDWAHYNHGYTSNILNEPQTDSLAFRRSSPIYFAEGLRGKLLICHGMEDQNVHFQDVVRLSQRLIELGKENWELAVYPVEDHAFRAPASWTDEYKRILNLFQLNLLPRKE